MRTIFAKHITLIIPVLFAITAIGCGNPSGSTSSKELRILQEQKAASESLTRHAVELIKENRIAEVRQLYKNRWDELATLRTNVTFDSDLTAAEKQNIEQALRGEQEAVTETLTKLKGL
jgi:hypothetical protein